MKDPFGDIRSLKELGNTSLEVKRKKIWQSHGLHTSGNCRGSREMAAVEAVNANLKNPASASTTWLNMLQINVAVYSRMEMRKRWERN